MPAYNSEARLEQSVLWWRTNLALVTAPWRLNLWIREAVPVRLHALRRAVWARRELILEPRQGTLGARCGQRNVGGPLHGAKTIHPRILVAGLECQGPRPVDCSNAQVLER
jgi:hypothetical protein